MSSKNRPRVQLSRRDFLAATTASATAAAIGSPRSAWAAGYGSANERPTIGYIGTGIRYEQLVTEASRFGHCAALCDVDSSQLDAGFKMQDRVVESTGASSPRPDGYDDYRRILDRQDIDIVVIGAPDHWHSKLAIEALLAGKDVYCEKPLTHNVAEGQQIISALRRTDRVMQVGTQQRSGEQFQTAVAMTRAERAGKVKRITCGIGPSPESDALPDVAPPSTLDWDRWLGPAPWVPYCAAPTKPTSGYGSQYPHSRCHGHFRWWYEYAGGKLTDWGAHHVDIAMWSLGKSDGSIGKFTIEPRRVDHPVDFADGMPVSADRFNTALTFEVGITFADGVQLDIVDRSERLNLDNGIFYECEGGRYLVNRGKLVGKPAEELASNPLPDAAFADLYTGPRHDGDTQDHEARSGAHMQNFFDCVKSRDTPISDVASHHRHLSVCHVANISMRLGRTLTYDPAVERFVDDPQADALLSREPRKGYETEA
ncbi:MAG: Gfo/Idh/MocA family oxidoreductase, partial [Planctomycetota bacterium]